MKYDDVIIRLGPPNNSKGELSKIAVGRAETALISYKNQPSAKLLITGGFGAFNRSNKPHAAHVAAYLITRGAKRSDILKFVESKNTIQDAAFPARLLRRH